MKIKIIQPYIQAQAVFSHRIPERARFSTQLGPLSLAALTPDEFEIEIINEQIEEIDFDDPVDIVGISTMTANCDRSYQIADRFRDKGVTIVMGGIHASFLPDEALTHCDSVVIGEAENSWGQVLDDWKNQRLKKIYRSELLVNMSDVPIPRRDLDLTVGFVDKLESSRGCPFRCEFCSTNLHFGNTHRTKPIDKVVSDIGSIHRNKKENHYLFFTDDNIIGNIKYAKQLFKAITPLNVRWVSQCSINIVNDDELLMLAAQSGCEALSVGFESLSEESLIEAGKTINKVSRYETQIKKMKDSGIEHILGNFVFGFDPDDESVFERTIEFIMKNEMDAYLTILTPYPKTQLRHRMEKAGRILHSNWSQYDGMHCVFKPRQMSPQKLEEGLYWAYQQVYPGQKLLVEDPKTIHQDNLLSRLSDYVLSITRHKKSPTPLN